jgi:hypothetical protein
VSLVIAAVDPANMLLPVAYFLALLLATVGAAAWLTAVRRGGALLVGFLVVLVVTVVMWGYQAAILPAIVGTTLAAVFPPSDGSRWDVHRTRRASGDLDQSFFTPLFVIAGVAALPLVLWVVVLIENA